MFDEFWKLSRSDLSRTIPCPNCEGLRRLKKCLFIPVSGDDDQGVILQLFLVSIVSFAGTGLDWEPLRSHCLSTFQRRYSVQWIWWESTETQTISETDNEDLSSMDG